MKTIISILIVINLMTLSSCDWDNNGEDFPPVPDIIHNTIIVNNSSHLIRVDRMYLDNIYPYTILPNHEHTFFNEIFEENLPFVAISGDSSNVVYDSNISVWHTMKANQQVSRSIMLESSYTGGKVNDKLYEVYYTFTDADYDEAVLLNEGG